MNRSRLIAYTCLLSLYVLPGCQSAPDRFGQLDLKKWRSDRGGCSGLRQTVVADFKAETQKLKGQTSNDITELLGRPDINQLADRNQKYYVYFLQKGPQCETPTGDVSATPSVALRFSALGLVTEVTFQQGLPGISSSQNH